MVKGHKTERRREIKDKRGKERERMRDIKVCRVPEGTGFIRPDFPSLRPSLQGASCTVRCCTDTSAVSIHLDNQQDGAVPRYGGYSGLFAGLCCCVEQRGSFSGAASSPHGCTKLSDGAKEGGNPIKELKG